MGLFGKKKKRTPSRRSIPLEEKQRRRADKFYVARAEKDPKLMDLYIKRYLGIDIPHPDPVVEEGKNKIEVAIIDQAIKEITENPELARRLSVPIIEKIAGIKVDYSDEDGDDGEGYSHSTMGKFLQQLDEYEEIKERLGRGRGGGFLGMDGNTIGQILLPVLSAMGVTKDITGVGQLPGQSGDQPVSPVRAHVVEINGQMKELSEDQYQLLLQQGTVKPLVGGSHKEEEPEVQKPLPAVNGDVTPQVDQPEIEDAALQPEHPSAAPAPAPKDEVSQGLAPDTPEEGPMKSPSDEPEEGKVTREPTSEERTMFLAVMGAISPSLIVEAMDKAPEDFVADLYTGVEEKKDQMSKDLLDFLKQVDMESFFEFLSLFTNHPEYGTFITSIVTEEGREWLLSVVQIVRKASLALS